MKYAITFGAAVAPMVAAHGMIKTPTPRSAGTAMSSACGSQIYNMMSSDSYGNIQGETQLIGSDFTDECNLWQCKGMQYSDNTANVQSYSTGDVVDITYDIRAPHTGTANVSIVDTASNTIIGDVLAYWSVFASNSQASAANETSFSITIPDLGGKCTTGGECVIQHYWDSQSAGQTYESCIDFTVGGSSSGSSGSASTTTAAATSAAAATSQVATTSQAATSVVAVSSTKSVVSAAATSSAAAETGDDDEDDSCDADDDDEAEDAGDDEDDDSCDADDEDDEPVASSAPASSAAPTTLVTRTSTAAAQATSAASSGSSSGSVALYGQCGGINYSGSTTCASGTCTVMNDYYSQCV
ncbi:hypothetical protein PFICI_05468 [Pestalotiopsis fici W106-1]|uniref:CBM1 domain-containing protein n=1 Tax=Pestalotiopsis fici (strain W106-1 / CGMCC3.15140) TaxID=1229662 RepID=W3XDU0_PESFW|nr:uncharacterized protein PFICI_05468 [Pestalotiopsis fici W106-1]ETS83592.1 hypothetical protein PFICI_05468 [Pestalotiopsis fici W106-1]